MHRSGVQILAGTDTSNPYCLPGFSLHDELSLLVNAGLTPAQALRSATSLPAQYVEPSIAIGVIATGRRADAVLLNANPLTDIHNTTRIEAVVCRGRYFDRAALDRMLRDVELYARRSALPPSDARRP